MFALAKFTQGRMQPFQKDKNERLQLAKDDMLMRTSVYVFPPVIVTRPLILNYTFAFAPDFQLTSSTASKSKPLFITIIE